MNMSFGTGIRSISYALLCACLALAAGLVAYYFYAKGPLIMLPADLIMWSESDMTGNMIKLLTGAPFYTPPEDGNSMIYTPGASLLTYAVLRLTGAEITVPHMRMVQVGFAIAAAIVATYNARLLHRLAYPKLRAPFPRTWTALTFCVTFLACTAPRVNKFVDALHTDSAALLVSMLIFASVLRYVDKPTRARLWSMALLPGVGYFFKQFLSSWVGVMAGVMFVDQPKNLRRLFEVIVIGVAGIAACTGLCYAIWGESFVFWCFTVMGGTRKQITWGAMNSIAIARSLDHLLRAWLELSIGVVGGALLLRGENLRRLGPLWLGWLALVASEALSSGAGWHVLYHFGPGVVIGCSWLMAALPAVWPGAAAPPADEPAWYTSLVRPSMVLFGMIALASALHVLPSRDKSEPRVFPRRTTGDIHRYIRAIEREFAGLPPERVLLGVGNWVYLRNRVLMVDRAVSLGDQPISNHYENFEGLLRRIRTHAYDKILVHALHRPAFLYDWEGWSRPSGVRAALRRYYDEVRVIPTATNDDGSAIHYMEFINEVSVLVPKKGS